MNTINNPPLTCNVCPLTYVNSYISCFPIIREIQVSPSLFVSIRLCLFINGEDFPLTLSAGYISV